MSEPEREHRPPHTGNAGSHPDHVQSTVNRHFDASASYWDAVYLGEGLQGAIYRDRQLAVLALVDAAALPAGARVLEIGCGAGHLTLSLAQRGFHVTALDASEAMVRTTDERMRGHGLGSSVAVAVADVHELPYDTGSFDLAVAVGVIPWLHAPSVAVAEMGRVLRVGGTLVMTADNSARLVSFTDPRAMLARSPLKHLYDRLRHRRGEATSQLHGRREMERLMRGAALSPTTSRTVGFGPFQFLGRPVLGEARGVTLHRRLQRLADRGTPLIRSGGWHYVVSATKR